MVRKVYTTMVWDFTEQKYSLIIQYCPSSPRLQEVRVWLDSSQSTGTMELRFAHPPDMYESSSVLGLRLRTLAKRDSGYESEYFVDRGNPSLTGWGHIQTIEFKAARGYNLTFAAVDFLGEVIRALRQDLDIPKLPLPKVTQTTEVLMGGGFISFGEYVARHFSWYWPTTK